MRFARITLAAALCVACLGAYTTVDAAPAGDAPKYQMQPYGQQYTPEQMEAARKIFDDNYAGMEQTRQALNDRQYELNRELASPNPDKGRIEALSQEIGKLRGQMLAARSDLRKNLAEQGLPPNCFGNGYQRAYGPCWAGEGDYYGRGGYYHHGRGHGRGHGGCWR